MQEIYIEIKNGIIQSVYSKEDMIVNVIDWDSAYGSDDETEVCEILMRKVKNMNLKRKKMTMILLRPFKPNSRKISLLIKRDFIYI